MIMDGTPIRDMNTRSNSYRRAFVTNGLLHLMVVTEDLYHSTRVSNIPNYAHHVTKTNTLHSLAYKRMIILWDS